jgi:hypothetical protein
MRGSANQAAWAAANALLAGDTSAGANHPYPCSIPKRGTNATGAKKWCCYNQLGGRVASAPWRDHNDCVPLNSSDFAGNWLSTSKRNTMKDYVALIEGR